MIYQKDLSLKVENIFEKYTIWINILFGFVSLLSAEYFHKVCDARSQKL